MRTIFFYLARNSVEGREVEMDVYIYIPFDNARRVHLCFLNLFRPSSVPDAARRVFKSVSVYICMKASYK